jgi:Metallo-peptidase family M12B Reprolysin-like/Secretion system C-terminal sorting domain
MKYIYKRPLILFIFLLAGVYAHAQKGFFIDAHELDISDTSKRVIIPSKYRLISIDTAALFNFLKNIPSGDHNNATVFEIPMPDGSYSRFNIWPTATMEPALAAKYPNILTLTGQGIDDRTATIKIDWTELGFHAMILSPVTSSVFIDPYSQSTKSYYISYFRSDLANTHRFTEAGSPFESGVAQLSLARPANIAGFEPSSSCIGTALRTYRMAIACTGEYALAATGLPNPTVAQTLSAIITSVNRVDGVYELELDIHLTLVAKEDTIIFTDPNTDPFPPAAPTPAYASAMLSASQPLLDSRIGDANYDLGQIFNTGGGGTTRLNSSNEPGIVCVTGYKGSCETGIDTPVGDPYDIDYVAHEIGHEFGAHHSYNSILGYCGAGGQFSGTTNSEPGSGTTIMCYAEGVVGGTTQNALCGSDNLQVHSDPDFNALGFDEITNYSINGNGNNCPVITATGNTPPVVNAGADYTIPVSTPFILTGSATDIDGDSLTYSWEQVNIGGPAGTWNNPSGDAPIFRSFPPVTVPWRYFPKLSDVINNTTTIGEIMPSYPRVMNFRLTVRDNHAGGGGVCNAQDIITVDGSAGPFRVSYPSATGITWNEDEIKTVTWDTAGTQSGPVNCSNVIITLSLDGGLNYYDTLSASVPNNGSAQVVVPDSISSTARIRVMAIGNVFYDISDNNFTIAPSVVSENWNVYPNPTANRNVTIVSNKADTYVQLSLYDDIGRSLYTEDLPATILGQTITVPMTAFSKGTYMLRIKTSRGVTGKKIILIDP